MREALCADGATESRPVWIPYVDLDDGCFTCNIKYRRGQVLLSSVVNIETVPIVWNLLIKQPVEDLLSKLINQAICQKQQLQPSFSFSESGKKMEKKGKRRCSAATDLQVENVPEPW